MKTIVGGTPIGGSAAKVSATTLYLGPDKGVSRLQVLGFGFRAGGVPGKTLPTGWQSYLQPWS